MNTQADPNRLDDRRSVLDAIQALIGTPGAIDEARAKQVRKAVDALRNGDVATVTADEEAGAATAAPDDGLDEQIDAGLETLRERVNRQVERRNRDYDKALRLMQEVETTLKANELHGAEQALHRLQSVIGNIPGLSEQRWKDIEQRLNRARPRLRKLESWRHWGTTRVRQDLIEQIRQLQVTELKPHQRANRIKQARAQWQAWDQSGDHAGKELWQEFDAVCEEAYKPCAEHFKQLKQQRRENLQQRRALIDSAIARYDATDWKDPDWRDLDKFIRQVRRDFHGTGNVEFKLRKKIATALEEALDRFEQHLARERERSRRARERLITDIESLADAENLREALNRLDELKKQWVITVTDRRGVENRLWQRFQDACDAVYRKRDATRRQHDAERLDHLHKKQSLIGELVQAAAAADGELLANSTALARIQERWQDIGPVPRRDESRLDQRWRSAQQQFRKALAAAEARARAGELDNLARRAALCHRWEQATLAGTAADTASARAEWNALPAQAGPLADAMEQRFRQSFDHPGEGTLAGNLDTKLDACLKLEVLLELASPPEYQAARMAYQVERLNASMHRTLDAQQSVEDLLRVVLTTGAVPAAAADTIEQRIDNCLAGYRNRL